MHLLVLLLSLLAAPSFAQDYYEPSRGTDLRADLADAIRPHAEWALGRPIQFIIHDLRTNGRVAFANVTAQRPNGDAIRLESTPMARRDSLLVEDMDGPTLQALLIKSGRVWVAVHHTIGATDAWWDSADFCPIWEPVLPETCTWSN